MSNFGEVLGNRSHLTFVLISDDGDVVTRRRPKVPAVDELPVYELII